jgi:alcohol dehydrogenase class IV
MPPPGSNAGSGPKGSETTPTFDLADHVEGFIGVGSISSLGELVGSFAAAVVTDDHIARAGTLDSAMAHLPAAVPIVIEPGEPTSVSVTALADRVAGFETLVAIGGGSVLDTAKLAAALVGSSSSIERHLVAAEPFTGRLEVVAVPTTAGSGAEVTRTCVVTAEGHKTWAWDDLLRPSSLILDASLTVGLPIGVTVSTGLDALVHAVEALTAQRRDAVATAAATWAIATLGAALPVVTHQPRDIEARAAALAASTAAGIAIDRCGTGIAHGLGHALGSLVPIPHGLAVAVSLWAAAGFNARSPDDRCGSVASALGHDTYDIAIANLVEEAGLVDLLRPIAQRHPLDRAALASETLSDFNAPMCANNVRPVTTDEVVELAGSLADHWNRMGGRR